MDMEEVRRFRSYLIDEAVKAFTLHPGAMMVTILVTTTCEIIPYPVFDYDMLFDENAEEQFFARLKAEGKTQFPYVLTMWKDHTLDMPKHSLRKRLRELDSYNNNSCILLRGENGIGGFQLAKTFAK